MQFSGQAIKCAGGETFDSLALELFGNERYAADMMNANPELCRLVRFEGGETLYLPVVDVPEEEGPDTQPTTAPWKE